MSKYFWCAIVYIACLSIMINAQTYERFNFGVFNQLNHARRHPGRFARYLNFDLDHRFPDDVTSNQFCLSNRWDDDNIGTCHYRLTTDGGREWYEAAIRDLRHGIHHHQTPFLRWSSALAQQCYDLISEQGPAGHYGHIGEDGSTLRDRMNRYATSWTAAGEILTYSDRYGRIGSDLIKQLILDDGIDTLSHRSSIFNPSWTHAGVSCGCHSVYSMSCCIAFGVEVETPTQYERPQVADQVNTCNCNTESFGHSLQHHEIDYEERHFSNYEIRLVEDSYDRGELSEVSYDSGPAQAIFTDLPADDYLGNSTLTFFPTEGRQHHSDQPDHHSWPYINTQSSTEAIGNSATPQELNDRLQITQGGENSGLSMEEIEQEQDSQDAALINAERTLGENINNTTNTNDPEYTGVAVPGTYEHRGLQQVLAELNRARRNPNDYAREHYQEGDPQYDILMSHEACDNFDRNDGLINSWLAYVNQAGPCGTDNTGATPQGYSIVDYFLINHREWGYTAFGLLYGSYYLENYQNIVDAIIEQMGGDYLFDCYYSQIGLGCACSSADSLTWAYILSDDLTTVDDELQSEWLPIYPPNTCSLLCPTED